MKVSKMLSWRVVMVILVSALVPLGSLLPGPQLPDTIYIEAAQPGRYRAGHGGKTSTFFSNIISPYPIQSNSTQPFPYPWADMDKNLDHVQRG